MRSSGRWSRSATPSKRRSRSWLYALLIPVCALAPWLVTWSVQQPVADPSADPSAVIRQATAGQNPEARRATVPSGAAVQALTKQLAEPAGQGYDKPVSAKAAAAVRTTPGKYQRVGHITIPRIGLDVSYGEGVHAAVLDRGPGHWPGTPLPGDAGTTVLSGHRNTHTAPFRSLNLLRPGDKIITSGGKRDPVTFRVVDTTIVREADYPAFVLKPAKDPESRNITLFACHPAGNPVFRIVVRATMDEPAEQKGRR